VLDLGEPRFREPTNGEEEPADFIVCEAFATEMAACSASASTVRGA
jgi:hypothetical protein